MKITFLNANSMTLCEHRVGTEVPDRSYPAGSDLPTGISRPADEQCRSDLSGS